MGQRVKKYSKLKLLNKKHSENKLKKTKVIFLNPKLSDLIMNRLKEYFSERSN